MARAKKLTVVSRPQRRFLDALPQPALLTRRVWEKGGVEILHANAEFCRLTGYALAEITGKNTRIFHGAKTDLSLLQHGRAEHQRHGEGWLCRQDGSPFFAQWDFSPLEDIPGAGLLVALYRDQSEVKRLRDTLLQSRKLDTIGRLASGVAHDFNTLLAVINGYCEIMARKIERVPEAKKDLEEIHRAGLKATAITRQILEFSRRQEAEIRVINYNTLIREIAEILRRVAGESVEMELRLSSDLGNARIDPTQFQQVLLNLCFNAREAMPSGGKLSIRTYNHEVKNGTPPPVAGMKAGFYAALVVTDTGEGMTPEVRAHVFEAFFTTKPQGTGLGLATVWNILSQHGGHVAVSSTPGQGTVFEVLLPETSEPEQTESARRLTLPVTRGTEAVLLIERDLVLRKMIAGILATDGYKVTEAASTALAGGLMTKQKLRPQLVLAPCREKSDVAFIRALHAKNPMLRIVNLSGEMPARLWPRMPAGTMANLPQPFALSALMRSVRALLDARPH